MPEVPDRVKLLSGPYLVRPYQPGARVRCLFRRCQVAVTSWTEAPLSWPTGLPVSGRGHPSLIVTEELRRAIRTESAAALMHWWGVSAGVVWRWRKAFAVGRAGTEGSERLIQAAAERGALPAPRGKKLSADAREQRRKRAISDGYGRRLSPGYNLGPTWTDAELALLGTMADQDVAKRIGKSRDAVRAQRRRRKVPPFRSE